MTDYSEFESRSGNLTCPAEDVFNFVTDIRNFEQFIPMGTINNWHSDRESCSFNVSMIGTVSLQLVEKKMFSEVLYKGDALNKNDFSLLLHISGDSENTSIVKIFLKADLNPMLKMMAAKPIGQFLEMLINEMESFKGWKSMGV
jgi:carbon monoxide dehydrogenase subunit G